MPLLLLVLALLDLRTELQLLLDHTTLTALMFSFREHTLAVVVLFLQPSLWLHYQAGGMGEPKMDQRS